MTKLAISVVLYASDLTMLAEVIDSIAQACRHASRSFALTCALDLVNNKPDYEQKGALADLARSASTEAFAVAVIEAGVNGGYGAGNNISIRRHEDADFHLVLNPDVLVDEAALTNALAHLASNPDVGLIAPQVNGLDGQLHYLCKQHPTLFDMFVRSVSSPLLNRLFAQRNRRFEMRDHDYRTVIVPVPYPTGCFMLFRRSVLGRIGGFDEGYFLHYEDADIGRRVSQVSQTAYVPSVLVLHKWSRDTHKSWAMRWITIKSGLRYWRKWGGVF
jgi:GT2 family glycosyltransferase